MSGDISNGQVHEAFVDEHRLKSEECAQVTSRNGSYLHMLNKCTLAAHRAGSMYVEEMNCNVWANVIS